MGVLIYIEERIMGKEKRRKQEEYFHKEAWNTYTILVLFSKINLLWKITADEEDIIFH